jgi:hypothetical protein
MFAMAADGGSPEVRTERKLGGQQRGVVQADRFVARMRPMCADVVQMAAQLRAPGPGVAGAALIVVAVAGLGAVGFRLIYL